MVLFNAIYWVDGEAHFRDDWPLDDVGIGVFFDAGKAWFSDWEPAGTRVVTNVGFGLKTDNLRVFFAVRWMRMIRLIGGCGCGFAGHFRL